MRRLKYARLTAIGGGEVSVRRSLAQFVSDIPYLLSSKSVPPRRILNEIFGSGLYHAGMSGGCRWKPFQISAEEFGELATILQKSRYGCSLIVPPRWVKTFEEWNAWEMERRMGIPAAEQLRLSRKAKKHRELASQAKTAGDEALSIRHEMQVLKADLKYAEPLNRILRRRHAREGSSH